MGLDGGTIISRSDVLRGTSWRFASKDKSKSTHGGNVNASSVYKEETLSKDELSASQWSTCAMSGEALQEPIVACGLGKLYNRQTILEYLLARRAGTELEKVKEEHRKDFVDRFEHIRSIKDVFQVRLARGEEAASGEVAKEGASNSASSFCEFICPVTGVRAGWRNPFSAFKVCGHVISNKCIKQVGSDECPLCGTRHTQDDIIPMYPSDEEVKRLRTQLEQQRALALLQKAEGKQKRKKGAAADAAVASETASEKRPKVEETS
eukprot:jgi/Chlat1/9142/Chrsp97S08432